MKDLTMTIVAYNNYQDIKEAINSILEHTNKKILKHIYIVDNGTNIASYEEIKEFKKFIEKFDEITYIDANENLGFGKGHNLVLEKIFSKYHAIINPDIILVEDSFKKIIEYMNKKEEVGMVIPKIVDSNGNIQDVYREELTVWDMFIRMFCKRVFKRRVEKHTMQDQDYSKEFQVPFGQGSFLVIRTELFKKLKGFDERYFMYIEDADLCKRVNEISKLMYYPETKVIHKWEKGSHKNMKLFRYHLISMFRYFKKWGIKLY